MRTQWVSKASKALRGRGVEGMGNRAPNERLAGLHRETGWTLRQFAQAVNRIGTECGTPTTYSAQTAHSWLKGHIPATPEVRQLVIEALAGKLKRPVSHTDVGFPVPEGRANGSAGISTVEELAALGRLDMDPSRRSVVGASLFSTALSVPVWSDVAGRLAAIPSGKTQRIGMPDVELVADVTRRFHELDHERGGRVARASAASFLVDIVVPHLKAEGPEAVRRAMMSAASELCYLIGYMAVDEGLHGTAQSYYIKALELAGAAEDKSAHCLTLHGMSSQAVHLGHGTAALRLADAAAGSAPGASPNMRAHLAAQQAYSAAVAGERVNAVAFMRRTENSMSHAEPESGRVVVGKFSSATFSYYVAQVKYSLGDTSGSIAAMKEYIPSLGGDSWLRRRVLDTARLAHRQLESGHLEEACATWHESLNGYSRVRSGRCDDKIRDMFSMIRPHLKNRVARELYERAREVAPNSLVA
ncbi:tetratricopeptide repeat protein [Streptomyces hygroscopicus]|uniref:tetratricopeptide repeat protein n=1 Tax=Streptomyces hygroscopicus TaxID=1912 RepID=UPI0036823DA6